MSYGGSESESSWSGRSSADGSLSMIASRNDDSVAVAPTGKPVDQCLVDVLEHGVAAGHVAVERCVADRHLRLVPGRDHHAAELVGDAHQDRSTNPRLKILLRDAGRGAGEERIEGLEERLERRLDRDHIEPAAEVARQRLGISNRALRRIAGRHGQRLDGAGSERIDREWLRVQSRSHRMIR